MPGFGLNAGVDADAAVDRRLSKVRKFGRSGFARAAVREMYLGWVKGELFQESFWGLVTAKVRKYRTRMASIGRKSPTDAVGAVCVSWSGKSIGEIFQDRDDCDRKCRISPESVLR